MKYTIALLFIVFFSSKTLSQVDGDQLGAWYMYFWNLDVGENWGFQGDLQHRNWNMIGDMEQLLLRGGITYVPTNTPIKFTAGYAYIVTGVFGSNRTTTSENRIYQEAMYPVKIGNRFYLNHRARFEQRWVGNQNMRTRFRYNLFLNVPINHPEIIRNTFYLALYNEIFINGQRTVGDGRTVAFFDRNRAYVALGYAIIENLRIQLGIMNQATNVWQKNQLQLSFHHKIQ